MTYLNGTRGAECYGWEGAGGGRGRQQKGRGNPIYPDARVEGRKTPYTPTLRLVLPPYQTETLTYLTSSWRWAG